MDRGAEYAGEKREGFAAFIAETVMPLVEERYAGGARRPWGSMGASNGGNISLFLASAHPRRFDRLLLMSPYLPEELQRRYFAAADEGDRIYMNRGSYDIASMIPLIDDFDLALDAHDVEHFSRRYNEGHSWGLWRATIDEGLLFLYGR